MVYLFCGGGEAFPYSGRTPLNPLTTRLHATRDARPRVRPPRSCCWLKAAPAEK